MMALLLYLLRLQGKIAPKCFKRTRLVWQEMLSLLLSNITIHTCVYVFICILYTFVALSSSESIDSPSKTKSMKGRLRARSSATDSNASTVEDGGRPSGT